MAHPRDVERAKIEHEAAMTAVLAVLVCWLPGANILTLVAGVGRWSTAWRGWRGHAGATATLLSAAALAGWAVFFLTA